MENTINSHNQAAPSSVDLSDDASQALCVDDAESGVDLPLDRKGQGGRDGIFKTAWDFWSRQDLLDDALAIPSIAMGELQKSIVFTFSRFSDSPVSKYFPEFMGTYLSTQNRLYKHSQNQEINESVASAFRRVESQVQNKAMQKHIEVRALDSYVENAITMGSNIFVSRMLVESLTEDELTAVIAHELGHVNRADNLKSAAAKTKAFAVHVIDTLLQSAKLVVQPESDDTLAELSQMGSLVYIGNKIDQSIIPIEVAADMEAVDILIASGINPEALKSAIRKVSGIEDDCHGITFSPNIAFNLEEIRLKAIDLYLKQKYSEF